jgi:hypothetical protein
MLSLTIWAGGRLAAASGAVGPRAGPVPPPAAANLTRLPELGFLSYHDRNCVSPARAPDPRSIARTCAGCFGTPAGARNPRGSAGAPSVPPLKALPAAGRSRAGRPPYRPAVPGDQEQPAITLYRSTINQARAGLLAHDGAPRPGRGSAPGPRWRGRQAGARAPDFALLAGAVALTAEAARAFPLPGTSRVGQLPVHAVWLAGPPAVR